MCARALGPTFFWLVQLWSLALTVTIHCLAPRAEALSLLSYDKDLALSLKSMPRIPTSRPCFLEASILHANV